jgi:hypothetical protein
VVKVVDILLGDDGAGGVILPVAVDSVEWQVHCSVARDKGWAHITKRGWVVVSDLWGWVCYPETIESQGEDGGERVGYGNDGEADDANRGEDDWDRGGEERVAN